MVNETAFYETKRQRLYTVLPLSSPFSANIEVSSVCNIKCKYCLHSLPSNELQAAHKLGVMSTQFFSEIISQFKQFPHPLKKLVINGVGEPLCNPNICDILTIAKQSGAAEFVEFFTNATLLTPELSKAIAKTGVDRVKISLQGLSGKKYLEVCGKEINFQELYNNISCFSSVKGKIELFIKIINIGIDLENDYESFKKQFAFADRLFLEHVEPWFKEVDYSEFIDAKEAYSIKNKYGSFINVPNVCPIPFYRLYINVSGDVFYCYSIRKPAEILNCKTRPLTEIWNSDERNLFLCSMLKNGIKENTECKNCTMMCDAAFSEYDNLDFHTEEILKRFCFKEKNHDE